MPAESIPLPPVNPEQAPSPPREDELEIEFDAQMLPAISRAASLPTWRVPRIVPVPLKEAAGADETDPSALAPASGRWGRFERKSGDGTKPFTRFITRPETSVAALLAADSTPSERTISPAASAPSPYHKIRDLQDVDFRPSRLQHVMNDTWTHGRLVWLDQLGQLRNLVVGTLLAVLAAVVMWPYLTEVLRKRDTNAGAATVAAEILPSDAIRQAAVRKAFDAYRAAPDFGQKLPWVLEPQRIESRMKDFYVSRSEQDPPVTSYEVSAPIRAGKSWWFTLTCLAPDGTGSLAVMKEVPGGGQLDWENFVSYGSMPWDHFHKLRPAAPQAMRVLCRLVSPAHPAYPAETHLACEIAHRSGAPVLTGYAPKNSRGGQMLANEAGLNDWKPLTLYLHWATPAAGPPVMMMGDLIRNNWLDALRSPASAAILMEATTPGPRLLPSLKP